MEQTIVEMPIKIMIILEYLNVSTIHIPGKAIKGDSFQK